MLSGDTEFIPLLSTEEEKQMHEEEVPEVLPILPLRNTVLFPGVVIPITVGRDKSIRLIRDSYASDRIIGVVAQQDPDIEDPAPQDLHSIGTVAHIIKLLQMPDGNTTAIIQGKRRFHLRGIVQELPYLKAQVKAFSDVDKVIEGASDTDTDTLFESLKELSLEIIKASPNIPSDASFAIRNIESPAFLVNFISSNLNTGIDEKQKLLELSDLHERARLVLGYLARELQ
ncbi:MAG: LON peptidase substrate-binding domain-containing protein, partial [Bacteroidales bacterium]|nr:LON peptidase substrate-binding domain-containing protein [Bacteroidales bacterium]